jgi:hypothetical protein
MGNSDDEISVERQDDKGRGRGRSPVTRPVAVAVGGACHSDIAAVVSGVVAVGRVLSG